MTGVRAFWSYTLAVSILLAKRATNQDWYSTIASLNSLAASWHLACGDRMLSGAACAAVAFSDEQSSLPASLCVGLRPLIDTFGD